MSSQAYQPLEAGAIRSILKSVPAVAALLGSDEAEYKIREVGDGNLNLVYIVETSSGGVVVKQALPYVRLVGDSWPLPLNRSYFEYVALTTQAGYVPGLVPKIFHFDRDLALIVMEYLNPHIVLRKGLIKGTLYPRAPIDIAEFLAQTLFNTSVLGTTAVAHKGLVELFAANTALCRITEDLVFTDPYREASLNRWTRPYLDDMKRAFESDSRLKFAAQQKKWEFMTRAEALIHGDLHTGSVMATANDTRVIDPEFAFVGPMGFDVGAIIANYLLAFFSNVGQHPIGHSESAFETSLLDHVVTLWNTFERRFLELWGASSQGEAFVAGLVVSDQDRHEINLRRQAFMRRLFADSLEFAGTKMIRRILGLAHVEDMERIEPLALRAKCERLALVFGRELILAGKDYSSIEDVVAGARSMIGGIGS
jgi:5-methylthioribose kinase